MNEKGGTYWLTAEELAERVGVRARTVRLWAREDIIPAVRINPKILRFDPAAVQRALSERTGERKGTRHE